MFEKFKNWLFGSSAEQVAEKYTIPNTPLTAKEIANANQEPWVSVLDVQVNQDNPKNGFFELDWNEYFIVSLRQAGYTGGSDEEVVDKWFQDLCREIGNDEGLPMDRRYGGYVNVNNLGNGKSEIG